LFYEHIANIWCVKSSTCPSHGIGGKRGPHKIGRPNGTRVPIISRLRNKNVDSATQLFWAASATVCSRVWFSLSLSARREQYKRYERGGANEYAVTTNYGSSRTNRAKTRRAREHVLRLYGTLLVRRKQKTHRCARVAHAASVVA